MNRSFVNDSTRHAGGMKRYHGWPTITTQTNAEHSWNVARIFLEIFQPEPTEAGGVLIYIQHHDSGEHGVGDMIFPIKANNPDLKAICDRLEVESLKRQGITPPNLTPWQRVAVKVCDLLEMLEFGAHEMRLGNTYAEPIVTETWKHVLSLMPHFDEDDSADILNHIQETTEGLNIHV